MVTARPASPKSVHVLKAKLLGKAAYSMSNADGTWPLFITHISSCLAESKRPTVAFAFKKTQAAMDMVFEQPKAFVSQSITQTSKSLHRFSVV